MRGILSKFAERLSSEHIVEDGVVLSECWERSNPKVLFVLKAAYDLNNPGKGWDLLSFARSTAYKGVAFRELAYWAHSIRFGYQDLLSLTLDNEQQASELSHVAIVNVKKLSDAGVYSDHEALQRSVACCGDLIVEQIEAISPDIVVCGSTWSYMAHLFQSRQVANYVYRSGDRYFVDFWHPANRFPRIMNCTTLVTFLRDAGALK